MIAAVVVIVEEVDRFCTSFISTDINIVVIVDCWRSIAVNVAAVIVRVTTDVTVIGGSSELKVELGVVSDSTISKVISTSN